MVLAWGVGSTLVAGDSLRCGETCLDFFFPVQVEYSGPVKVYTVAKLDSTARVSGTKNCSIHLAPAGLLEGFGILSTNNFGSQGEIWSLSGRAG